MVINTERILEAYHNVDPRAKDYLLTSTFIPVILINVGYLYFCLKWGPQFMKNREPYNLKPLIILHNVIQIMISSYVTYYGIQVFFSMNWSCEPLDYGDNPMMHLGLHLSWVYVVSKFLELLDTVFFVLRKKYNQLTFLHLFHHVTMATIPWVGLRYVATGHGISFGLFNSVVHMVMYTYYLIANLGPEYRKYLWWKKYVTIIQLVQFVIIFVHNFVPLLTSCVYPKFLNALLCVYSSFFFFLFSKFYYDCYVRPEKEKKKIK
ncbi:GNS1/SUR4 family domain-containing protein [Phthorimaea operculella]|nr:GNS1/SUR4 family domain-containing protein [Phthorimaea operculella]